MIQHQARNISDHRGAIGIQIAAYIALVHPSERPEVLCHVEGAVVHRGIGRRILRGEVQGDPSDFPRLAQQIAGKDDSLILIN